MKKLKKEKEEFDKEVAQKKGERESTKEQEQALALVMEIKQLKDLRFKEEKWNDDEMKKFKQELDEFKEDTFLL